MTEDTLPLSDLTFLCHRLEENLGDFTVTEANCAPSQKAARSDHVSELKNLMHAGKLIARYSTLGLSGFLLSHKYLIQEARVAELQYLDIRFGSVRQRKPFRDIAEAVPEKLWDVKFQKTAKELGLQNLNAILDNPSPTGLRFRARHLTLETT